MRSSPLSYALRLIKIRERAIGELRRKMQLKKYEPDEIDTTINKLIAAKLLDDERFARMWLRSQLLIRPAGRRLLELKMYGLGLSKDTIANAFGELAEESDELANAKRLIELKSRTFSRYDGQERKAKMLALLIRRGFSYSIAKEIADESLR